MESVPWEKLESLFSSIAEILKRGGEYFWPLVVRQQYINGLFNLGVAIALMVGSYLATRWFLKKSRDGNYGDEGMYIMGLIVSVIVGLLGLIPLYYAVSMLVNPEWWALVTLGNLVK